MWVSIGHYTFHEAMTQALYIQIPLKKFPTTFVPMDKENLLFYWCLNLITVCLPSPRRSYPMVFMHTVQCSHFLIERHSSFILKLTSVLPMTYYVAVLWPELWLQCWSVDWGWGCSEIQTHHNKLNASVAMAMIAPHHQSSHWYFYLAHGNRDCCCYSNRTCLPHY